MAGMIWPHDAEVAAMVSRAAANAAMDVALSVGGIRRYVVTLVKL